MGVTVAVTRVAANTSTGTQDFTSTDLGGLTPKAALLIATRATADGTAVDGAGMYLGMTDGTNHVNQTYEDEHGQATSDPQGNTDTTSPPVLVIQDGTADSVIDGSAAFDSFITNGIRINWTDAPGAAYLVTVVLFAGSDLSAAVLLPTSLGDTVDLATDITAIGFEADVFVALLAWNVNSVGLATGLVHNNRAGTVTQRSLNYQARAGRATMEMYTTMRTDAGIAEVSGGGVFDWRGEFGSFDSSGFTVTTRNAGANSRTLAGLALRFGASPVVSSKVYTFSTPTSTGSATDAGAGFEPQFVMYLANRAAVDSITETDADAGPFGIVMVDGNEQYTQSVASEDAAADSNTQSLSDDRLNLPTHTGGSGHEATFTSFGATGVTWNWTATSSPARLWPALAIGVNPAGGSPQTVNPSGIATAEAVGSQVVLPGAVTVAPGSVGSGEAIGALSLLPGAVMVSPAGIASGEATGSPVLTSLVTLLAQAIASLEALGTTTVLPGTVALAPGGVASSEAFGSASLTSLVAILVQAIASGEAFGTETLVPGAVALVAQAVGTGEAFGTAFVSSGDVLLLPGGVASLEAFGSASLLPGAVTIQAQAVASPEEFGATIVAGGGVFVIPAGIVSGEGVGSPALLPGAVNVLPASVVSAEAFGAVVLVSGGVTLLPVAIGSFEAFGSALLEPGSVTVAPAGIDSSAAFGNAALQLTLALAGIASLETFGAPLVTAGGVVLMVTGIATLEAFGTTRLVLTGVLVPAERVWTVAAEVRVWTVAAEERVWVVAAEDRTWIVA